jgi:two-component system cell cycle response regulator
MTTMRVLLAHGSAAVRDELAEPLRTAGHEVLEAGGVANAFALCRQHRPDVLLVTRALCERDGLALVDLVKGDGEIFRTAVVLIAAAELPPETARDELRRGAQDFLIEPVREAELVARVQAAGRMKILQEELAEQTRRLEDQLFEDPLTRLYNRRFLLGQLGALVSGARRHGRPLALAMVDLDAFKGVNDRHGHRTGDEVLVATADALQRALRAEDVLGRLGGEEFLALLPDTDAEAAARAGERLRAAVADAGGPVPVTASVGWAVLEDGEAADGLVRRADAALYEAKAAGRNRVQGPATLPRRT